MSGTTSLWPFVSSTPSPKRAVISGLRNTFDSLISQAAALDPGRDKMPRLFALFFLRDLPKSLITFTPYLTIPYADES